MPNIIIHEKVAYNISKKYKSLANAEFYLGALAPDAVNLNGFAPKEIRWTSHCRAQNLNTWRENIIKFYSEQLNNYNKEFLTGYLIHILTDIVFDDYFYNDVTSKIKKDNPSVKDPHPILLKCMDEYSKVNMNSDFLNEIRAKLTNATYYNILNISKEDLKAWSNKKLNEKFTTTIENKYIDDELITEVTSKVINEYEKVKEKLNLQD